MSNSASPAAASVTRPWSPLPNVRSALLAHATRPTPQPSRAGTNRFPQSKERILHPTCRSHESLLHESSVPRRKSSHTPLAHRLQVETSATDPTTGWPRQVAIPLPTLPTAKEIH